MSIVVAMDFSPCSQVAVRLAAAQARHRGSPLVVIHAVEEPVLDLTTVPIGRVEWEREMLDAARATLERDVSGLRESGIVVDARVSLGNPVGTVRDVMAAEKPELVVVGTHGRKGAARFFLGSAAENIVRHATCPVLVTGEDAPDFGRWEGKGDLRLAVATDGSAASRAALSWTRRFDGSRRCELSLLRVYSPEEEALRYGIEDYWTTRRGSPEVLRLLQRDLRRDAEALLGKVPPAVRLISSSDVAEALADEAALFGADALVVGVPKRRSVRVRAIEPASLLRVAALPVLCVPEALEAPGRGVRRPTSILVASDLSDASREAVLEAYSLLSPEGGHVELCTVYGLSSQIAGTPSNAPLDAERLSAIEARLRGLVPKDEEAGGVTTGVSVIEATSTAQAIVAAAERLGVDLVAVGSHGRSGFKRAVLGSVAEEVARRCPCPVLIVGERGLYR